MPSELLSLLTTATSSHVIEDTFDGFEKFSQDSKSIGWLNCAEKLSAYCMLLEPFCEIVGSRVKSLVVVPTNVSSIT